MLASSSAARSDRQLAAGPPTLAVNGGTSELRTREREKIVGGDSRWHGARNGHDPSCWRCWNQLVLPRLITLEACSGCMDGPAMATQDWCTSHDLSDVTRCPQHAGQTSSTMFRKAEWPLTQDAGVLSQDLDPRPQHSRQPVIHACLLRETTDLLTRSQIAPERCLGCEWNSWPLPTRRPHTASHRYCLSCSSACCRTHRPTPRDAIPLAPSGNWEVSTSVSAPCHPRRERD